MPPAVRSPAAPAARENRTRWVALGMLSHGPMGVYQLRQAIAGSVGHFWMESFGQLYPALRQLAAEGLVTPRKVPGARGREATVYALAPRGREALAAWVARPPAPEQVRSELLLKLFFGAAAPPEATLRALESAQADLRAELRSLEAIEAQWGDHMRRDPGGPFGWLTLDYGLRLRRAGLDWAEAARKALRRHAASALRSRPPHRNGEAR